MDKENVTVAGSTALDFELQSRQARYFENDPIPLEGKIETFSKYASYMALGRFICQYELFKMILDVPGAIIECGVFTGGGLFSWAKLCALLEPNYHSRRVFGFDTFQGFPSVSEQDSVHSEDPAIIQSGKYCGSSIENIQEGIDIFDLKRHISHIPKIHLVGGDVIESIPAFLDENPHLVVALLYLDLDLYEPTKMALKYFLPRMPKGALIAFDELNCKVWPGETLAVAEEIGVNNLRLKRLPFSSLVSFAVIE